MNLRLIQTAVQASIKASRAIMQVYEAEAEVSYKTDNSPVTNADHASHRILLEQLAPLNIPVLSEEGNHADYEERRNLDLIWIVDPLDGTKEFIRKNGEFCICLALVRNQRPIFGLIASPTEEKILMGGPETGAYYFDFDSPNLMAVENRVPDLVENDKKTVTYSRSHLSAGAQEVVDRITDTYGTVNYIRKGSALKFIDLTLNRADFYPRMAPTMEWDIAAGQAIYESVGGEVVDFTNFEPLVYNKPNLYNPFFLARKKGLAF